jgi:antitoxin CcdA
MRIMRASRARAPTKVATNLSVRSDLVKSARAFELNLSEILEQALEQAVRERQREAWLEENEDAIDAYNARVGRRGVFSDGLRRF